MKNPAERELKMVLMRFVIWCRTAFYCFLDLAAGLPFFVAGLVGSFVRDWVMAGVAFHAFLKDMGKEPEKRYWTPQVLPPEQVPRGPKPAEDK